MPKTLFCSLRATQSLETNVNLSLDDKANENSFAANELNFKMNYG